MATILPPTAPATPAAPAAAAEPAAVLVPATAETAAILARLAAAGGRPPDLTLSASQTRLGDGIIRLDSSAGGFLDLRLPSGFSLSPGATLSVQFQVVKGGVALRLVAIDGRPASLPTGVPLPSPFPATGAAAGARSAPPAFAETASPIPTGANPGLAPVALTATVLRPAPAVGGGDPALPGGGPAIAAAAGPAPLSLLLGLAPGSRVPVRLAETMPPPGIGATPLSSPSLTPTGLPSSPPATPSPSGATVHPPAPTSPSPSSLPSPAPAPAAAPASTPAPPPLSLTGRVLTAAATGGAVVDTAIGVLSLPSGLSLPAGGTVRLEVMGPPQPPPPPLPPPAPVQGPGGWPALTETLAVLTQADRQIGEQLMRALPQVGPRLAAALVQAVQTARGGDIRLPGGDQALKALEKAGRRDLADRLRGDLDHLADEAARPRGPAGDWQALTLPFVAGAQVDPVRLFLHRPDTDDNAKRGGGGGERRFILDVEMTRLGRIQFDGLVQRADKRFDLIIRTDRPLEPGICRDIAGIFAECAQLTGIRGGVSFQSGRGFIDLPPTDSAGTSLMV